MELLRSIDREEGRVFTLAGEIDLASAMRVADLPIPPGATRAVLDIRQVRFIDSAGIAAICGLAKRVDGELVLSRPTPHVLTAFEMLGLEQIPGIVIERGGQDSNLRPRD